MKSMASLHQGPKVSKAKPLIILFFARISSINNVNYTFEKDYRYSEVCYVLKNILIIKRNKTDIAIEKYVGEKKRKSWIKLKKAIYIVTYVFPA
jgi:hypothetical protein